MQAPITFRNQGQTIYGMVHMPDAAEKPCPGVVMCHGLGGTKVEAQRLFLRLSRKLEAAGIASLRFDLRGCGESDGNLEDMALSDHLVDISAALDFFTAREEVDSGRIGLLGYSLGGSIVSIAAPRFPCVRALAVWSGLADLMASLVRIIPEDLDVTSGDIGTFEYRGKLVSGSFLRELQVFYPAMEIRRFDGPVLVIHAAEDEIVPPENIETFRAKLRERGGDYDVSLVKGADHHFSSVKWQEELLAKTVHWFKKKLS